MRCLFLILAALVVSSPLFLEGAPSRQRMQGHPVIRSFHLGPFAPETDSNDEETCAANADACTEEPRETCCTEEAPRFYNPPACRYCLQCNYQHWCPYCGYCPLYDDRDVIDEWDNHATWPSKRSDGWMHELEW